MHGPGFVKIKVASYGLLIIFILESKDSLEYIGLLAGVLCLLGATLSLSLAAIGMCWLLAGIVAVYAFGLAWKGLRPVGRVNAIATTLAILCLGGFLAVAVAQGSRDAVQEELIGLRHPDKLGGAITARLFLLGPAVAVWREAPWFGVGGWGFRYLAGLHTDPAGWEVLELEGMGNVHNDPLQFLAEFGVIGGSLLAAVVIILAVSVCRSGVWRRTFAPIPLLGLVTIFLYSLMDIPFRCPAVLYAWLVVIAAMPGFMLSDREYKTGDDGAVVSDLPASLSIGRQDNE